MKAIDITRFGPPEVLQIQEVAKPVPQDNEVLIRVRATTVFAADCELRGMKPPVAFRLPCWTYMTFFRHAQIVPNADDRARCADCGLPPTSPAATCNGVSDKQA